jgi:hypothetical protein
VWRCACFDRPVFVRSSALLVVTILGAAPPCAFGQQLRFGVIGGTNLTRDSHSTNDTFTISEPDNPQYQLNVLSFSRSHSFIAGPAMELSLPRNFSVDVNALHRNLRSTQVVTSLFPNGTRQSVTDQFLDAKTWEFPVLLKYALPVSRMKPFVEFGPSFRIWQEPQDVEPSNYGVTVGLGAEMNRGHFKFGRLTGDPRCARPIPISWNCWAPSPIGQRRTQEAWRVGRSGLEWLEGRSRLAAFTWECSPNRRSSRDPTSRA